MVAPEGSVTNAASAYLLWQLWVNVAYRAPRDSNNLKLEYELPIWWRPSIPIGDISFPPSLKAAVAALLLAPDGAKIFGYDAVRRRTKSSCESVVATAEEGVR